MSGRSTPKMLVFRPGQSSAGQADTASPRRQHARVGGAAQRTGRTAGNGSLMRTAPVALAYLDDEAALVEAARAVSELTHYDPEAGDACVLWCPRSATPSSPARSTPESACSTLLSIAETCGRRGSTRPKRRSLPDFTP